MRRSQKSNGNFPVVKGLAVFLLFLGLYTRFVFAEVRLIEGVYDPEVAARGFTGVASCSGVSCLDLNPAFLYSEDEGVKTSASIGTRFNKALFDTVDNWQQTKDVFASDRYREILLKSWNFMSRQTAKVELDFGLRLNSLGFSYSPVNLGAILFTHDPVLPFGELYIYSFSSLRLGYAYRLSRVIKNVKSLTVGASVKHTSAMANSVTANKFAFNPMGNQFDQSSSIEDQWMRARLGADIVLDTSRYISISAVLSGIPIYHSPIANMPDTDYLDFQPGVAIELGKLWWGNIRGYYALSRLTRDENFWLKQHAGIEGSIGKFKTAIGVSDAMITYGLSIAFPICKFSVSTYGVEYSNLVNNITDRVYWFKVEL